MIVFWKREQPPEEAINGDLNRVFLRGVQATSSDPRVDLKRVFLRGVRPRVMAAERVKREKELGTRSPPGIDSLNRVFLRSVQQRIVTARVDLKRVFLRSVQPHPSTRHAPHFTKTSPHPLPFPTNYASLTWPAPAPESPKAVELAQPKSPRLTPCTMLIDNDAAAEMLPAPVLAVEEWHAGRLGGSCCMYVVCGRHRDVLVRRSGGWSPRRMMMVGEGVLCV